MLNRLPEHLRASFIRLNKDQPIWFDRLALALTHAVIFALGLFMGMARTNSHLEQAMTLTQAAVTSGEECVKVLDGMARAAIIIARNDRVVVRRTVQ
jgi:hypothetical protein